MKPILTPHKSRPRAGACMLCRRDGLFCPRCQAFERLPKNRYLQALITFSMGIAHPGQEPLVQATPLQIAVAYFATFALVIVLHLFLFAGFATVAVLSPLVASLLLPPFMVLCGIAMMITSGLFRGMHQYIMHNASHDNFGKLSRLIGEAAVIIAGTVPYRTYRRDHEKHHDELTREVDGDQQLVAALGFVPGLDPEEYWRRLRLALLGKYLWPHLKGRWQSNFGRDQPLWRKALVAALHLTPLMLAVGLTYALNSVAPTVIYAVVWLIPCTYGTYASLVLYALGLHRWYHQAEPGQRGVDAYIAKTGARFFGDPCPPPNLTSFRWALAWSRYWARLLGIHLLFSKLFVIGPTDNQHHDEHHADPKGRHFNWVYSAFTRSRLAERPALRGKLWHTWSLFEAIRINFAYMAALPSSPVLTVPEAELPQALNEF